MNNITCICDEIIVKSEGAVSKIRAKILVVRGSSVYAVCKSCSTEVKVPLAPAAVAVPALELPVADVPSQPGPALLLRVPEKL